MKQTVVDVRTCCERCQKAKTHKTRNRGPLGHIISPSIPMHQLSMDFLLIDTRAKTKVKILTVIDEFTKYGWAFIVKSEKAKSTAETLYSALYTKFGLPAIVHTDRGQTFVSKIIQELNKMLHISHSVTTSYRPQSNATCERLNETIIARIRTLIPKEKKRWHVHVDSLVFAYNATVHDSTQMSPYYAMFGRNPKLPLDFMVQLPQINDANQHTVQTYTEERNRTMKEAFKLCAENIDYLNKIYDVCALYSKVNTHIFDHIKLYKFYMVYSELLCLIYV